MPYNGYENTANSIIFMFFKKNFLKIIAFLEKVCYTVLYSWGTMRVAPCSALQILEKVVNYGKRHQSSGRVP